MIFYIPVDNPSSVHCQGIPKSITSNVQQISFNFADLPVGQVNEATSLELKLWNKC